MLGISLGLFFLLTLLHRSSSFPAYTSCFSYCFFSAFFWDHNLLVISQGCGKSEGIWVSMFDLFSLQVPSLLLLLHHLSGPLFYLCIFFHDTSGCLLLTQSVIVCQAFLLWTLKHSLIVVACWLACPLHSGTFSLAHFNLPWRSRSVASLFFSSCSTRALGENTSSSNCFHYQRQTTKLN